MYEYLDIVSDVLTFGEDRKDRTGTGTKSIFGRSARFYTSNEFPLVTTKYTWFHGIKHELLWFIKGDTNIKYLLDNNVHIWDAWATQQGDLGPIYGAQWSKQLMRAIEQIKYNPMSRRIIVDSWQVPDLPDENISPQENVLRGRMALAPCHMMYQFYVHTDDTLDVFMYQRSVDVFLGLPFNIASYALLLMMVAQVTGKKPGRLVWQGGDVHIYNNHIDGAKELISRKPKKLPKVELNPDIKNLWDFTADDIQLVDYEYWPKIKGEISV